MKPLNLEETRLKEEIKHDCFWDSVHYKNPDTEKVFNLICHLEDFEVQYWELVEQNKQLKHTIKINERSRRKMQKSLMEKNSKLENNWNELKNIIKDMVSVGYEDKHGSYYWATKLNSEYGVRAKILLNKMEEMERINNND